MRDHSDAAFLCHIACGGFRKELSVKDDHRAWICLIEKFREFVRHIPGREDVFAQQIARVLIIVQVMNTQDPPQAGQAEFTKRGSIPNKMHQLLGREAGYRLREVFITLEVEPAYPALECR